MRVSQDKAAIKVKAGIRQDLVKGCYPPGSPIVIQDEADRFGVSQTPVREALAWLAGEGLIEHSPLVGWRTFDVTPSGLSDLYDLHLLCVFSAVGRAKIAYPKGLVDPPWNPELRGWGVFDDLMDRSSHSAISPVYRTVRDRLQWLRTLEHTLLEDQLQERYIMVAAGNGDWSSCFDLTREYHDRRRDRVTEIAVMAMRLSSYDD